MDRWQYSSSALGKDEWSGHAPPVFPPEEGALHCAHLTGAWVGLIAPLDTLEKNLLLLPGIEPRSLRRPGSSLFTIPTELSQLFRGIVQVT
jgi:hypothetical protein